MKGKILDYNIQESKGIISGDDGQRYNFEIILIVSKYLSQQTYNLVFDGYNL